MNDLDLEVSARIALYGQDEKLKSEAMHFMQSTVDAQYSYNFNWMGRPIIQYPQDIVAMQEIIWSVQPDLIIETGVAHGGSLIFSAAMLELNAACGGSPDAEVLGIDIDIRAHNRAAIEGHPMSKRISLIEGSSISPSVIAQVKAKATGKKRVLVCLDSNHTHGHVIAELNAYASLTSVGSYCVVFDTVIDDLQVHPERPWGPGNSPKTAVREYLTTHPEFEIDKRLEGKLLLSVAPEGFLKRIN